MSNTLKVIESITISQNLNAWNAIQNSYNIKVDGEVEPAEGLIEAALKDFREVCETYHINADAYKFIRVTYDDPVWQVDFHVDEDPCGAHASLYEIYYRPGKGILQRCFSIG